MRVCFVCTGNICRSPMAEVVLRDLATTTALADGSTLADHLEVDSAGTGNWHAGEPMDPRAAAALADAGYPDHGHEARAFTAAWFDRYDLVVALARSHQQTLAGLLRHRRGGDGPGPQLVLLRDYDPAAGRHADVPDPYYGDRADFEESLRLVEAACRGLARALAAEVEGRDARPQATDGSSVTSEPAS